VNLYGTPGAARRDPAVVADPEHLERVFAWRLTRTEDPFGNAIVYQYLRDRPQSGNRLWDQLYLAQIQYVDVMNTTPMRFLVSLTFDYETRPDPFSDYRSGFEIRTTRRCRSITIRTHADQDRLVRRLELVYANDAVNGVSLLKQIAVAGFGDVGDSERLPPLDLHYTKFKPETRRFIAVTGSDLPAVSLADPSFELVDVFGRGLPDIVELNGVARYWRNLGDGRF